MLYSIENREKLEKLNGSLSLPNQVKTFKIQNNLGKQNIHEDIKKKLNPLPNQKRCLSRCNKNYSGNLRREN